MTYSKLSNVARFWDLVHDEDSQLILNDTEAKKNSILNNNPLPSDDDVRHHKLSSANVIFDEYKSLDCKDKIMSLAWKPKNPNI